MEDKAVMHSNKKLVALILSITSFILIMGVMAMVTKNSEESKNETEVIIDDNKDGEVNTNTQSEIKTYTTEIFYENFAFEYYGEPEFIFTTITEYVGEDLYEVSIPMLRVKFDDEYSISFVQTNDPARSFAAAGSEPQEQEVFEPIIINGEERPISVNVYGEGVPTEDPECSSFYITENYFVPVGNNIYAMFGYEGEDDCNPDAVTEYLETAYESDMTMSLIEIIKSVRFVKEDNIEDMELVPYTSEGNYVEVDTGKDILTFNIPENLKIKDTGFFMSDCGDVSGWISFEQSLVSIAVNPCGRGGIGQNIIDNIVAYAATGHEFNLAVDNCTVVEEAFYTFDSDQTYEEYLQEHAQDCRGFQGGYFRDFAGNGNYDLVIEFLFQSTAGNYEKDKADIISIINNISITNK